MNKILITAICFCLVVALFGLVIELIPALAPSQNGSVIFEISLGIGGLIGAFLLFINGSIVRSRLFWPLLGFGLLILTGVIFRILHLSMSSFLTVTGVIGLAVVYLISFFRKPNKVRLDYLKPSWLILYSVLLLSSDGLFDMPQRNILIVLETVILWLAIFDFAFNRWRKGTLFHKG